MTAAAVLPVEPRRPSFAHASEAELARILDFYAVRWEYEPHTFPIGWSLDGEVTESFSPDFYLPDLELYVELTTLKQSLVRKKNRKLRRLRELYPDVRIKLFYARDFRMLLVKFGRLALAEELSGTTGQATPPRVHAETAAPGADPVVLAPEAAPIAHDPEGIEPPAPSPVDPVAPAVGRSARGRRRGRRRRAEARAAASTGELQATVIARAAVPSRAPAAVPSAGTQPA